ncbi:hypothetical protein [Chitinophaga polysaccharea]|uniref:hypothetical protein n=1 Tax=Chitinophaga polysaccharea TaxID=1293035 RepID=UPI001159DE6D|nr:hypothetical protein [Chitinophaga polysaccharea]
MAVEIKKIFRTLFGILFFFLGSFCAFIVLLNTVSVGNGRVSVDLKMDAYAAVSMCFYIIASAFFFWRGVRLMKPLKKREETIDFLGEEF